jgi:hypothetical protein
MIFAYHGSVVENFSRVSSLIESLMGSLADSSN